jgi:predicted nucleotide-binding protein
MTKRQQQATSNESPTQLIISKEEFNKNLDDRIAIGNEIYDLPLNSIDALEKNKEEFSNWNDYNSEYLKHVFNKEYSEYKKKYDNAGNFAFVIIGGGSTSLYEEIKEFKDKVNSKLDNLKKLRAKTDLLKSTIEEKALVTEKSIQFNNSNVFIVHGHDDEAKVKTARFIERLGLQPIILHEQASGSKTVIEKIETYSNVGFGIVLYTACDIGAKAGVSPEYRNRARQNVIFEHGFLIGKIGRENVCALVKGEIETPNDISGVVYVKMDDDDAWHIKIARELRNSGYKIDLNKL